jgi:ribonuclease-3
MEPKLEAAAQQILTKHKDQDPKSLLQELVQARGYNSPQYRTVSTDGPEHEKTFEVEVLVNGQVYGSGQGNSKRTAAKAAARVALETFAKEE